MVAQNNGSTAWGDYLAQWFLQRLSIFQRYLLVIECFTWNQLSPASQCRSYCFKMLISLFVTGRGMSGTSFVAAPHPALLFLPRSSHVCLPLHLSSCTFPFVALLFWLSLLHQFSLVPPPISFPFLLYVLSHISFLITLFCAFVLNLPLLFNPHSLRK